VPPRSSPNIAAGARFVAGIDVESNNVLGVTIMIRRISVSVLAAAACALIAGGASGQIALASVSTPLSASSHSVAAPPAQKCAANFVPGTVGGQSKCLSAGQHCQQASAKDYTQYGFACNKVGTRYQLARTTTTKPAAKPAAKPAVAKSKPAAAPAHH
jgi:hypothetical protein